MTFLIKRDLLVGGGNYGGEGYIAGENEGIVTVGGEPAERRIFLLDRKKMSCVRDVWSGEDGAYVFERLNPAVEFLMVAIDHKKQYEPVAYDFVKPYVAPDE
ncbi:hypothetical protein [Neisseria perflava]|uniref:hypothetical protein n=1 Tax=Neisseria perflava TaxID=33053 RepID=UPI00209F96AF|nr:hypothetical protein [Neisseria perflava]MCP1659349.1 hypothetical protein [Neisseria perflava]